MTGLVYAGALAAMAYWVFGAGQAPSALRSVLKVGALGLPLVVLIAWGWPVVFCLGVFACIIGDFLLSRDGEGPLRAGIAAFAVGHLFYIVELLPGVVTADVVPDMAAGVVILALVVLGLSTRLWLLPRTGGLRVPVAGYVVLILAMGVLAMLHQPVTIWLRAGALLFILSDLVLAAELFVLREGWVKHLAPYLVWPLYLAGQAGLILGFMPLP